jgi:hypothetical protein
MGVELESLSEELCLGVIGLAVDTVKFDGAGDMNSVGGDTESVESFSGGLGLCRDECESGEGGLEEEGGFSVALEAAFAEACIDDSDWDLLLAAFAEESRPEFEFHEDKEPWLDGVDGFANGPGKVEWEPDDLAVREALSGEIKAGIGGRGDNDEPAVGGRVAEFVDNFLELDDFADADGVEPCDWLSVMLNGELSEQFLGESAAVAAMAEHAPEDGG